MLSSLSASTPPAVRVGDYVRIRGERWLVREIQRFESCAIVAALGASASNAGRARRWLTPFERVEPIAHTTRSRVVGRREWRYACRAVIAANGTPATLRTAGAARMDLLPHQLEPALAVLQGLASRVLIADDVGLGKTIQAGLIASELIARSAASRVLILTPAGLRDQWVAELQQRFGLTLTVMDAREMRRRQARLPVGVNPWTIDPLAVSSLDYVKRAEVLPVIVAGKWDLVVIDEAHHLAQGSDRYEAINTVCRQALYVVLLTATPHSGDLRAFEALCRVGGTGDELLVFRRTRADIGLPHARRVHRLSVRLTAEERRMHACLEEFLHAVQRQHGTGNPEVKLAVSTLRKRACSSAFALHRSVMRRLATLGGHEPERRQLDLPLDGHAGEYDEADAPPEWTAPALADAQQERYLLAWLAEAAALAAQRESKLVVLSRLLRRLKEPAIVFTEYRDTLQHIRNVVLPDAAVIHGGLSRQERLAALTRFEEGRLANAPQQCVLLATDAAGEGLNLHQSCRIVVNLELPWNPMRLEQRIGRVDRIGQTRRVHAFHLIAGQTMEMAIVERLRSRLQRAQNAIGTADPIDQRGPRGDEAPSPGVCRLETEAHAERTRLQLVRRMAVDTGTFPVGTLTVFCKRQRLRVRLQGRRLIVLLNTTAVDRSGRVVASHVTPLLLPERCDRSMLGQLLTHWMLHGTDQALRTWSEETRGIVDAFWTTWLTREAAVSSIQLQERERGPGGTLRSGSGNTSHLQPGLFDRRAERDRATNGTGRREARHDHRARVLMAEHGRALTIEPSVALILIS